LTRSFGRPADFLKVFVVLGLFAASLTVGLIYFPDLSSGQPPTSTAMSFLVIQRSENVPTYLLDQQDNGSHGRNIVTIGMDVSDGTRVNWTLSIWYATGDHLTGWRTPQSITVGRPFNLNGSQVVHVTGTMNASHSYTEFQTGYLNRRLFHSGDVTDDAQMEFFVSGPDRNEISSGPRLYESPPALVDFLYANAPANVQQEAPAPFTAEVLFNAGTYELQGSGPKVTGSPGDMSWDWLSNGTLLPSVAVGVDASQEQGEQNDLFIAAALFGLAGAALAALLLELIDAIRKSD